MAAWRTYWWGTSHQQHRYHGSTPRIPMWHHQRKCVCLDHLKWCECGPTSPKYVQWCTKMHWVVAPSSKSTWQGSSFVNRSLLRRLFGCLSWATATTSTVLAPATTASWKMMWNAIKPCHCQKIYGLAAPALQLLVRPQTLSAVYITSAVLRSWPADGFFIAWNSLSNVLLATTSTTFCGLLALPDDWSFIPYC